MPRTKGRSNRPHPQVPLDSALNVARAIVEHNAGKPMNRLLLAQAMGNSPSSSTFRALIASSAKYGLTEGNYSSETISMTPLGDKAIRPRNEQERIEAIREAMRQVGVYDALLEHFTNAKLPAPGFLKNTLEREPFGVDPGWSMSVAEAFTADAEYVGYLREIGSSPHIVVDGSTTVPAPTAHGLEVDSVTVIREAAPAPVSTDNLQGTEGPQPPAAGRPVPMQIFISYSADQWVLEELKGILDEWRVPYLVGDEPQDDGRPISKKVADTMRQCTAAIFVVTDEIEVDGTDSQGHSPWSSVHIDYQLGAASLLYRHRIVILRQSGAPLRNNLSGLKVIEFAGGSFGQGGIRPVALDLLRELIDIGALRLVSALGE